MTVEQTNIVDLTTTEPMTGNVSLVITDHLSWDDNQKEHMWLLQEKINAYLRFIESGEVYEKLPAARGKEITIRIVAKCPPSPDAERFFSHARSVVSGAGLQLKIEFFPENK